MINKKLCLVSSSGGHLIKLHQLDRWWSKYERFWVVRDDLLAKGLLNKERLYFGYFPENRNVINAIRNFILAVNILRKEKPDLIFSLGAGVALPFFLVAKSMGIKTIFMETFILVDNQTLTGRLLYHVADYFLVQNKQLKKRYPRSEYCGSTL